MQHFQSSAACVFLWQSVASSEFALRLVYLLTSLKVLPLHPSSTLFHFHISCEHCYLRPIFCMREIPSFQVCRNGRFWKCTLPLKCQMLCPEYQMLLFDACCWTPTTSSHPRCCRSSKVRWSPLRMMPFLRSFSSTTQVHYHFCQFSLLCKRALILKEASPSSHVTVQKHTVTAALGILL